MDKYYIVTILNGGKEYKIDTEINFRDCFKVLEKPITSSDFIEEVPTTLISTIFGFIEPKCRTATYLVKAKSDVEALQTSYYEYNLHPYLIFNINKKCIKAISHTGKTLFIDQDTEEIILPFIGYLKEEFKKPPKKIIKEIVKTDVSFYDAIEELRAS